MTKPPRPSATIQMPGWVKRLTDRFVPDAVDRAMKETRAVLLDRARENVGARGPRFLRVRTGRLLRSLRTDLKTQGQDTTLTLRAARHGWIWENRQRNPRKWASEATDHARKAFPGFLRQAIRREVGRGGKA